MALTNGFRPNQECARRADAGFSLIERIVALAIVAIVAMSFLQLGAHSFGLPSWSASTPFAVKE
jgi:prepilin-type N-terminal cleavage/methylation domain-containing protein